MGRLPTEGVSAFPGKNALRIEYSRDIIQRLRLQVKIPAHNGCVNSICWNESGKLLLSGSDDKHLSITDAYSHVLLSYVQTGHRSNIFSAKFLPSTGDHKVVSCSGDGVIICADLEIPETSMQNKFSCHYGTAYEIMTIPNDPNTFLSCGEDGMVRWFDLRTKTSCSKDNCKEDVLINCHCGVTALSINPVTPYQLAVGCADSTIRVFDRRMLGTQATGNSSEKRNTAIIGTLSSPQFANPSHRRRITSLDYSQDGQEMLVSYTSDFVYLFNVKNSFNKDPVVLSAQGNTVKKSDRSISPNRPLMKRLRVRGDWSDTGPQARPESEFRGEHPRSVHANLMQRMSDVLTSMYNRPDRTMVNASSASEESEMEETNESEAAGSNNAVPVPAAEESGNNPPMETVIPENHQSADATADSTMEETDPPQNPPVSETHFPEQGIDLSFTTIEVNAPIALASDDAETQPSSGEALNLSLRNIRQEMASAVASDINEKQPVVLNDVAMEGTFGCDSKEQSENVLSSNDQCPTTSNSSEVMSEQSSISQFESTDNDCDKQSPLNDVASNNPAIDACSDPNLINDTNMQLSDTFDCTVEMTMPEVVVESIAGASNSEPLRDSPITNHREHSMTVVMDVHNSDVDSDEEQSDHQLPDNRRFNVPSHIDELFAVTKEDDEEDSELLMQPEVMQRFIGHRNARTMIKESTFWGNNFVMSGSDCGHIFIWDKYTAELVMLMEADHHVVNCLQPHPFDPILASSGIDYDIKIWAPLQEEPFFDTEKAVEVMKRNKVMLEETKDTITVPASFMIRMLASINQMTSGSGWRRVARQLRDEYRNRR